MEKSPSKIPHLALALPKIQPRLPPKSATPTTPSAANPAPTPPSGLPREGRPLKEPEFPAHTLPRPPPQIPPPMPSVAPSFSLHLEPKNLAPHSHQLQNRLCPSVLIPRPAPANPHRLFASAIPNQTR